MGEGRHNNYKHQRPSDRSERSERVGAVEMLLLGGGWLLVPATPACGHPSPMCPPNPPQCSLPALRSGMSHFYHLKTQNGNGVERASIVSERNGMSKGDGRRGQRSKARAQRVNGVK